jgi:hypothetical protein
VPAVALGTVFLGLTMVVLSTAGLARGRDWIGYAGFAVAAVGVLALVYFG